MRSLSATTVTLLLIALLTWLSIRAFNPNAERFDLALGELDRFATAQAMLRNDMLSARAGLLRNYDPLVRDEHALDASLNRIQIILAGDTAAEPALSRLAAFVLRQEDLIEQFKSDNALLRNSLAYFARFSVYLSAPDDATPLSSAISALGGAVLRLTLNTSATAVRDVQNRLDDLARRVSPAAGDAAVMALLAHARLLDKLLPATDIILRELSSVHDKRNQDALRATLLAQQLTSRKTAREFRFVLYLTSLLLVALLVFAGVQLRARVQTLRRRAAFEHVLAGVSMNFANAPEAEIEATVAHALRDIARWLGADRAWYLHSAGVGQTITWCRDGISFPPGWPDRAPSLLSRHHYPRIDTVVHVPALERMPHGAERRALAAAGLRSWTCATATLADGTGVLMGFDAIAHASHIRPGEPGLLRVALDTIINALGRRALEHERARLTVRLEQARRLETVGTLASGIAHNFNNIIGAILGYVEIADEQHAAPRILAEIRKAGERARDLVDQILTFARRHDAEPSAVDLRTLSIETASLLRASLPAQVALDLHAGDEPVSVVGVPAQLQQVILNLCNNAAQAMGQAGRIDLDIAVIELADPAQFSHGMLAAGRYARITVSDTGRGMDQAVLERLFEPFFTTRPTGNGLGLATARDTVRQHGGAIHVWSAVGQGSRFEVWLPHAPAGTRASGAALPFGQGEAVLVLERDAGQLLRDEEMLAALGYEPVGFTSVATAWEAFAGSIQRFDLVLLAHSASIADMLALSQRLHRLAPRLPILLATSAHDEFNAGQLLGAGIADVVPWPLASVETALALQSALRRSSQPAQTQYVDG
jgi:signal transduction histidine kinase